MASSIGSSQSNMQRQGSNYKLTPIIAALLSGLCGPMQCIADQSDITFVVAGKTGNYRQQADGRVDLLNYHFFAEIFLQKGGRVTAAMLLSPASAYQLSVEHAVLDTLEVEGSVGFATFATTTFLDLGTSGERVPGESCATLRKPFDAGQTDFVHEIP